MKIGFNIIATGKYDQFINPLIDSLIKHCTNQFHIYLFTDKYRVSTQVTTVMLSEHLKWPGPTLSRYSRMLGNRYHRDITHLFYLDVDMLVVDTLTIPNFTGIASCLHPGYYKNDKPLPFCRNKNSRAYLENGKFYYCGGFQGGSYDEYIQMSRILANNIISDGFEGIIATWHDESHYNKYINENKPAFVFGPDHCYPESGNYKIDKKPVIMALDKNHSELRSE